MRGCVRRTARLRPTELAMVRLNTSTLKTAKTPFNLAVQCCGKSVGKRVITEPSWSVVEHHKRLAPVTQVLCGVCTGARAENSKDR